MIATVLVLSFTSLAAATGDASVPLIVNPNSHLMVMEYENWFGPHAATFQGTAAKLFLQFFAGMKRFGEGYDSADPAVIKQHLAWFEYLGLDAALIDVTNNVSCIFNTEGFIKKYIPDCTPAFRLSNQTIRNNTGSTYPSWTQLGTSLKLIPILGGHDNNVLYEGIGGKNALEKEIEYFGALMSQYPDLNVIYDGKPLMLIFLGAAQDPDRRQHPLWFEIRNFLSAHPEVASKYTFRMMALDILIASPASGKTRECRPARWRSIHPMASGVGSIG